MNWDAFQRDALDALGHKLYRLAGAETPPPPDIATMTPLQRAVLRAADRRDAQDSVLHPLLATARNLRADPAAKRALWPSLRALRRRRDG